GCESGTVGLFDSFLIAIEPLSRFDADPIVPFVGESVDGNGIAVNSRRSRSRVFEKPLSNLFLEDLPRFPLLLVLLGRLFDRTRNAHQFLPARDEIPDEKVRHVMARTFPVRAGRLIEVAEGTEIDRGVARDLSFVIDSKGVEVIVVDRALHDLK